VRLPPPPVVSSGSALRSLLLAAKLTSSFPSFRTEFLTLVSHEIRTPIASILGICELLLGDQISDEQRQLVLKAIQSGENLLELVGTVLVRCSSFAFHQPLLRSPSSCLLSRPLLLPPTLSLTFPSNFTGRSQSGNWRTRP
jgi:hypothetical protein